MWGTDGDDNIIWGTAGDDADNIVWGTDDADNIMWGTAAHKRNCRWSPPRHTPVLLWDYYYAIYSHVSSPG